MMKAQVNGIEVEGTPAEVAEFVREIKAILVMDDGDIDRVADQIMEAMKMPQRIVVEEQPDVTKFDEHEIEKIKDSVEYVERAEVSSPVDYIKEAIDKSKMEGVKWEPAPMPQLHGPTGSITVPDAWKYAKVVDGGIKLKNSDIIGYSPIADFSTADHTAHMTIKALDPLSPKVQERQRLKNFLGDINWSALPFTIAANEEERDYPFAVPNLYFDYVDRMFVVNNVEEAARLISGYVTARHMNQKEIDSAVGTLPARSVKEKQDLEELIWAYCASPYPFRVVVREGGDDTLFSVPDAYEDYVNETFKVSSSNEFLQLMAGFKEAKEKKAANEVDSDDDES